MDRLIHLCLAATTTAWPAPPGTDARDPWDPPETPEATDEGSPNGGRPAAEESSAENVRVAEPVTSAEDPLESDNGGEPELQPDAPPPGPGQSPAGPGTSGTQASIQRGWGAGGSSSARRDALDAKYPAQNAVPLRFRIDVDVGQAGTVAHQPSYLAVADDLHLPGLSTGVRFDVPVGGQRIFLGARVGYHSVASDSTKIHGGLAWTQLALREVHIAPRLSVRIFEGIDAVFSIIGGPSFGAATYWPSLQPEGTNQASARSRVLTGLIGGTGGLAFYLPRKILPRRGKSHMTVGLEVDLGYIHRFSFPFSPQTPRDDDLDIAYVGPEIGRVQPAGGLHGHVGVFVRFM